MYYVCVKEFGAILCLGEFKTTEECEEFMKHPVLLADADETEDGEEVVAYPEYMFIETEQPEPSISLDLPDDDLPF